MIPMKLNDLSESKKMLKLLKENRNDPRPPRSYSEFSKSPKDKKHSFEKSPMQQQLEPQNSTCHLYSWGLTQQSLKPTLSRQGQEMIVSSMVGIVNAAAGEGHTLYVNSRGEVFAYGNNHFGQMGIDGVNNLVKPTIIPSLRDQKVTQVSCGPEHSFLITSKSEVFAWGLNIKGQLGLGMYENVTIPTLVYSLLPFGSINSKVSHKRQKSANDDTSLKERSTSIDNIMEQIVLMKEKFKFRQTKKSESAEVLTNIVLQSDEVVQMISCGALHTLVLTNKNRLFSCGFGEGYALGHEDNQTISEFKQLQYFSRKTSQSPRQERIERIACGLAHSGCVVEGRPFVWGMFGQREQLTFKQPTLINVGDDGMSLHNENILDMKMGECFVVLLTSRGEVYSMGENIDCQLGIEGPQYCDTPQKLSGLPLITQIACGRNHTLAIAVDNRQIFGWGSNQYGQITGNQRGTSPIPNPRQIFNLPSDCQIQKIVCGSFHSLILASNSFELPVQGDEQEFMQEDVPHRKSTQNLQQTQQFRDEIERLQEELEKQKQEQEALKMFNMQLLQRNEKMKNEHEKIKNELIISSKKKLGNETQKKQLDQKTQTQESFLVEHKKGSSQNIKKQSSKFDITALEVSPERPIKYRIFQTSLDIDFNEIQLEKQISEGGYGIIYRAKWRETLVAVKMFKIEGMNENHIRDFLSECHAMEALRHPNIVMFLGACTKPPNLAIVLEYCTKGSLWNVLQSQDVHLSWEDRKRISLDAAKGVWYLHCFNPPILHRDLKSLNLLLDDSFRTKLADFGWTRTMANYMTSKIGTYQWMAPEVIGGQTYTEKADVFSFGIILWEIAAREPPYRNISGLQVSIEVLNNDFRPTIPKNTPEGFARLTRRCWDRDPDKRPSFKEIIKELEMMKFPRGL